MTGALARYETRRAGWSALTAVPVVLACGALIVSVLAGKGTDPSVFVAFWLRQVLPLAFGMAIVAVPAAERCLEVQLTLPTPIIRTLARRAGWCGLCSAATTSGLALVAGLTGTWHPVHGLLIGQLTWLSPALALVGVAAAVFAVSGTTAFAGAAVAGTWLVQDLTGLWYVNRAWARPLYLFVDDDAGVPTGTWWTNRLTLLCVGLLLLAVAAVVLAVGQERVFTGRLRNQGDDS